MRTRPTLIISFLLLALSISPAQATGLSSPATPPLPWNAREAVRFALRHNPDNTIGQQRLLAAQAAIDLERSVMAPQFGLSSQYSQTTAPMYSFGNILNQREFNNSIDFNAPGRTDSLNGSAQVRYRLFNGGRDRHGVEAAIEEAAAAQLELAAIHATLAFEVVRAFHGIKQATEIILANQAAVEAVEASLQTAQARHDAGLLLLDAVLDLEVQLSQAKENLIQSKHALTLAKKVFQTLLGLEDASTEIDTLADNNQEPPPTSTPASRFELKAVDAMIIAAQARVHQAKAGSTPTVDSFANYMVEQGTITGGTGDSWQAGVTVQYTLADGHRTSAETAKAAAWAAELQGKKDKLTLAINLEIEQARITLQAAEERLLVTGKTIGQARESAEINRLRFTEGLVLPSDLIAAENRLSDAKIRRIIATTARQIAIADLRRATGLPQFTDLPEKPPASAP